LSAEKIDLIESSLDFMNEQLSPLKEFVLPGGSRAAAICHQARSVCRRAERRMLSLGIEEEISATSSKYLNRLSDFLFVMARSLNQELHVPDVLWKKSFDKK
jgi:cob(I)alamin adenosyltransferase